MADMFESDMCCIRTLDTWQRQHVSGHQAPVPDTACPAASPIFGPLWTFCDERGVGLMADRTVAVLAGGLSHERDVSLRSGRRLSAALKAEGIHVEEWDTDAELISRLREQRPDAVVVALHGGEGENGSVQAVLELLDVPYVGTTAQACRRAW